MVFPRALIYIAKGASSDTQVAPCDPHNQAVCPSLTSPNARGPAGPALDLGNSSRDEVPASIHASAASLSCLAQTAALLKLTYTQCTRNSISILMHQDPYK